jgi:hypothetical protein
MNSRRLRLALKVEDQFHMVGREHYSITAKWAPYVGDGSYPAQKAVSALSPLLIRSSRQRDKAALTLCANSSNSHDAVVTNLSRQPKFLRKVTPSPSAWPRICFITLVPILLLQDLRLR